uniref:Putative secreted protein n=1 Tax=Anopheles darlingi TaxID=43151 RepID=A0A2M4D5X4_ANODA
MCVCVHVCLIRACWRWKALAGISQLIFELCCCQSTSANHRMPDRTPHWVMRMNCEKRVPSGPPQTGPTPSGTRHRRPSATVQRQFLHD